MPLRKPVEGACVPGQRQSTSSGERGAERPAKPVRSSGLLYDGTAQTLSKRTKHGHPSFSAIVPGERWRVVVWQSGALGSNGVKGWVFDTNRDEVVPGPSRSASSQKRRDDLGYLGLGPLNGHRFSCQSVRITPALSGRRSRSAEAVCSAALTFRLRYPLLKPLEFDGA